jgi:hypothetical protein
MPLFMAHVHALSEFYNHVSLYPFVTLLFLLTCTFPSSPSISDQFRYAPVKLLHNFGNAPANSHAVVDDPRHPMRLNSFGFNFGFNSQ